MLWGGWEERKIKRPCGEALRAFYFFDYCYVYRDTLREREIKKETVEVGIV